MKKKVMVADDDEDNRAIARAALEIAGYEVVATADGEETMARIGAEAPAVLLLDLSMPKLNGWEVARRLREDPAMSGTAIVAFTAHALAGDELKARVAGCDDYIAKPCLPRDIVEKVSIWIERKAAEQRAA